MPSKTHRAPPKPPLTHFLCLPLLAPTSTPQLKASLAYLKSTIEALDRVPQKEESEEDAADDSSARPRAPLIPPTAFRPLGSLHLTLGVMSLKDPEMLAGAIKLLQDLDLEAILREVSELGAEGNAKDVALLKSLRCVREDQRPLFHPAPPANVNGDADRDGSLLPSTQTLAPRDDTSDNSHNHGNSHDVETNAEAKVVDHVPPPPVSLTRSISPPPILKSPPHQSPHPYCPETTSSAEANTSPPPPRPPLLTISLSGLSTFPPKKAHHATVLHTMPHDPTSRLYSFCLRLLSQFKDAGYLLPEPQGKERELTLHATLINTVYAKAPRTRNQKGRERGCRGGDKRLTFDAREILRLFNGEDGYGTLQHPTSNTAEGQYPDNIATTTTTSPSKHSLSPSISTSIKDQDIDKVATSDDNTASASSSDEDKNNPSTGKPYTFASSIPISTIQICEMGAKKLDPHSDTQGLGQKYTVVAEKNFSSR